MAKGSHERASQEKLIKRSTKKMNQHEEYDDTTSASEACKESLQSLSPIFTDVVPSTTSTSPAQLRNSETHELWMSDQHSGMSALELNAAAALCSQRPNKKASKKHSPAERLQRSRERNRMHARKTRQRKKEQMQILQGRVEDLRQEQIRLKQSISEKQTASILVGLFSTEAEPQSQGADPVVEELLKRPQEEIPDSSKIPELPALILPGNHKKGRASVDCNLSQSSLDIPNDGIDYELLGKDRSKCSAEELDRIRRERNRMHAKRTRDRKRIFMDKMEEMCKRLEAENALLSSHLSSLDGDEPRNAEAGTPCLVSPSLGPSFPALHVPEASINACDTMPSQSLDSATYEKVSENHLTRLLEAAGSFCKYDESRGVSSIASAVSASTDTSVTDSDNEEYYGMASSSRKRRRLNGSSSVRMSITTNLAAV